MFTILLNLFDISLFPVCWLNMLASRVKTLMYHCQMSKTGRTRKTVKKDKTLWLLLSLYWRVDRRSFSSLPLSLYLSLYLSLSYSHIHTHTHTQRERQALSPLFFSTQCLFISTTLLALQPSLVSSGQVNDNKMMWKMMEGKKTNRNSQWHVLVFLNDLQLRLFPYLSVLLLGSFCSYFFYLKTLILWRFVVLNWQSKMLFILEWGICLLYLLTLRCGSNTCFIGGIYRWV